MKVGTDGVLLGAWTSLKKKTHAILDIGTGTGLISLLLAQRSTAEMIDAIEIEAKAYEQCVENFEASPWGDRLFCYHAGLDEFTEEIEEKYDLIISNPPFFTERTTSTNEARNRARRNTSLPFDELLESVSKLLAPKGVFTTIAPFKEEERIIQIGAKFHLFPKRITHVKGNPSSIIKRSLMEFHFIKNSVFRDELIIETARHQYTAAYINLTRDFYLKM
ncbi:MAG: methyltransferase [Bacteroidota bacterium]